ncbi:hypothetical protein [Plasmodium yoelii yoelii]|uniref:Uncharacterized protein n=1 Tax=Plasmodium yoelii yoelii TaxID=73239 RepID=Q7RPW5_PLAYO|nr:hypothetical protein [Plasmodium yoelii yoelii]
MVRNNYMLKREKDNTHLDSNVQWNTYCVTIELVVQIIIKRN